ncbi:hypothetical protein Scep_007691 [Stephania cephalantha]|uniref:Uncharacterized protein n=1 Tax=Stephania cephalantha TaxID=152367 RepID=A0AAP0KC33_9MAGN
MFDCVKSPIKLEVRSCTNFILILHRHRSQLARVLIVVGAYPAARDSDLAIWKSVLFRFQDLAACCLLAWVYSVRHSISTPDFLGCRFFAGSIASGHSISTSGGSVGSPSNQIQSRRSLLNWTKSGAFDQSKHNTTRTKIPFYGRDIGRAGNPHSPWGFAPKGRDYPSTSPHRAGNEDLVHSQALNPRDSKTSWDNHAKKSHPSRITIQCSASQGYDSGMLPQPVTPSKDHR